ncbi:hypothetical protein WN944_026888 [Citrus x changshan-huyou]|uniref:Uncharacterized protein n=1 Tax=Citrus x changshan-huyou TaxID=2935761 RepID=A0AAP0LMN3_9ROSI
MGRIRKILINTSLSQISSPSSFKAQTQSFQNSTQQPKFGLLLAGLMELESDQVMVEERRLGGGAADLVPCSSRSVDRNRNTILAEPRRMLQATGCMAVGGGFQVASKGGRRLWVDDALVGSGLLTAASCLNACAVVPYAVVKLLFVMVFVCGS